MESKVEGEKRARIGPRRSLMRNSLSVDLYAYIEAANTDKASLAIQGGALLLYSLLACSTCSYFLVFPTLLPSHKPPQSQGGVSFFRFWG